MNKLNILLFLIVFQIPAIRNIAQNSKIRLSSIFMYSTYSNPAKSNLNGYFEGVSNSGFDGEFSFRVKLNNKQDLQIGLGTLRRIYNFSDLSSGKEIHLVSRENFFSFPLLYYRKFSIIPNYLEFSCGSGLSYSILDSQEYFSREGILPIGFENKSFGYNKKLSGIVDFPFYIRPNEKYNLYILLGNRFSVDMWDSKRTSYYLTYSGYVGISYCFNKISF